MGSDYDGVNSVEQNADSTGRTISGVVFAAGAAQDGPKPKGNETAEQALIRSRMNPVLRSRKNQLNINVLGLRGGRPYVNARLARFPGEPDLMFCGGTSNGAWIQGRRDQAHILPYLSRVAVKINQYVFGQGIKRDDAKEEIIEDITRSGKHVDAFMADVSSLVTACGWCWIGVDAPPVTKTTTKADVINEKIRPYWQLYAPQEVVDWAFDATGALEWLLVETVMTRPGDAKTPRVTRKVRVLWDKQNVTVYTYKATKTGKPKDEIESQDEVAHGFKFVPFVNVGTISPLPWPFDSLESVQKTIMDLQSANRQNYFEGVFPQRYFPESMAKLWMDQKMQGGKPSQIGMAIGMHEPVFVGETDVPPGVVSVNAADFDSMRTEVEYLTKELFNTAGLLLRQESRAAVSAESKAFDQLEIEQGLRERAQLLQEAEKAAVDMSVKIDANFGDYTPVYPAEFSVRDFIEELKAYVLAGNVSMPPEMSRAVLIKMADALNRMGTPFTPEEMEEIRKAIGVFDVNESFMPPVAALPTGDDE